MALERWPHELRTVIERQTKLLKRDRQQALMGLLPEHAAVIELAETELRKLVPLVRRADALRLAAEQAASLTPDGGMTKAYDLHRFPRTPIQTVVDLVHHLREIGAIKFKESTTMGLFKDFKNNWLLADGPNTLPPATRTTTASGTGVDMDEVDSCFAILAVGTVSGGTTAPTLDAKLQESTAATGTYTDIPGATFTQVTTADHLQVINFKRTKRHVRGVGTMGGTTPSILYGLIVGGEKKFVR